MSWEFSAAQNMPWENGSPESLQTQENTQMRVPDSLGAEGSNCESGFTII